MDRKFLWKNLLHWFTYTAFFGKSKPITNSTVNYKFSENKMLAKDKADDEMQRTIIIKVHTNNWKIQKLSTSWRGKTSNLCLDNYSYIYIDYG